MTIFKIHIYFLFFLILIINGCYCGDDYDPDEDNTELKACTNIDKVSKTITFEIYAKYNYNNEPIQNEGKVIVYTTVDDYIFDSFDDGFCKYEITGFHQDYEKHFNENGKAIITIDKFDFDNKYDKIFFSVQVSLPGGSSAQSITNSTFGSARYDSPESSILFFSYKSDYDL